MTGNLLLLPPGWEIDTSLRETNLVAWHTRGPTFRKTACNREDQSATVTIAASERQENDPELRYCRVCFNLVDGRRLLFTDPRKFGRIELWSSEIAGSTASAGYLQGPQGSHEKLGPEPLSEGFTPERLMQALSGRKSAVKQALLNQEVVAGLGNIYADEALYYARIHPLRRANSLAQAEIERLHRGIVTVLTLGIEHGGTSFNDYRDLWGEAGDNYNHVRVYQKDGTPCVRCGTPIERIVVAQRSTHFCPTCQKLTAE
jgi:formamidopyrimidine-DNA glycosylase